MCLYNIEIQIIKPPTKLSFGVKTNFFINNKDFKTLK